MSERSRTPWWALERIEHARGTESTVLDLDGFLTGHELTTIPEEVFSCTRLERLHLDNNALTVIPDLSRLERLRAVHLLHNPLREVADQPGLVLGWSSYLELKPRLTPTHVVGISCHGDELVEALAELPHLTSLVLRCGAEVPARIFSQTPLEWLDLSGNGLVAWPNDLERLTNLRELLLGGNQLSTFPDSAAQLTQLVALRLADNQLTSLPDSIAQLTNLRELDLRNNRLASLPDSIAQLSNLRELHLGSNRLASLPDSFARLANLRELNLAVNQLTSLPDNFARLTNLQELSLTYNQLTSLPGSVTQLTNLRKLDLGNNQLTSLPDSIAQLANLRELDLGDNQLTSLPDSITKLTNLRQLYIDDNQLTSLPDSITKLTNLYHLNVAYNRLTSLPDTIAKLANLENLNIGNNRLTSLPASMATLKHLRMLHITDLPIMDLPAWVTDFPHLERLYASCAQAENVPRELLRSKAWEPVNLPNLRAFFREVALEGLDVACEAKLLVVGEGEAGKTSLVRRLLNPEAELPRGDEGTQGIDVRDWVVQEVVRVRDGGAESTRHSLAPNAESPRELTVHVWDFAGQEIAYPTHQFFLSRRSVYALVVSSRHTHMLDYWLNIIQLLSDASPVVLIDNQKGDQPSGTDPGKIKAAFSNVKTACATNLLTRRGLPETEMALRAELRALPLVGQVMPKSWKRVRDALAAEESSYITLARYRELCDAHDFAGETRQAELLSFFHDLGVCLHFDTPGLSHWVILRPGWATAAVYRVVRDGQITAHGGRFARDDLRRIWHEAEYRDVRDALLELMTHFKLCYRLPVEDAYIIPLLLPDSEPSVDWEASSELRLRYDYEFMPHGITTALTVSVYPLIERQDLVWRHGGVFATDGARAWVHEEPNRGRLHLRVTGRHQKQLLGVLHHELSKIHARFHGLRVRRWIPCPCMTCQEASEPFLFDEEKAQKAFKAGRELQCQVSYEMLSPQHLLRLVGEEVAGVEDAPRRAFISREGDPLARGVPPAPRQVFISYKWGGESEQLAEAVETGLRALGLPVVRDQSVMGYKDDIGAFMKMLGDGHCVVAILSDGYLKSHNCMTELVQIGEKRDFWQRIFPITLADAAIYKPIRRIEYTKHWQQEFAALNQALDGTDKTGHGEVFAELQRYQSIAANVDRITKRLSDMNTLTPEEHQATKFEQLARALRQRLDEVRRRKPVS